MDRGHDRLDERPADSMSQIIKYNLQPFGILRAATLRQWVVGGWEASVFDNSCSLRANDVFIRKVECLAEA